MCRLPAVCLTGRGISEAYWGSDLEHSWPDVNSLNPNIYSCVPYFLPSPPFLSLHSPLPPSSPLPSPPPSPLPMHQKPSVSTSSRWLSAARELHSTTQLTSNASTSRSLASDHTHYMFSGDDISRDHMTSHVTTNEDHTSLPASLGRKGEGASKLLGVVSATLPLHTTDVHKLKDVLQDLMQRYGIRGVRIVSFNSYVYTLISCPD